MNLLLYVLLLSGMALTRADHDLSDCIHEESKPCLPYIAGKCVCGTKSKILCCDFEGKVM